MHFVYLSVIVILSIALVRVYWKLSSWKLSSARDTLRAVDHSKRLERDHDKLQMEYNQLLDRLKAMGVRTPEPETEEAKREALQREMVIASVGDADPLWKTIVSFSDEKERIARAGALAENLSNEERQFQCGRAAEATYWCNWLRDVRVLSQAKLQKEFEKRRG